MNMKKKIGALALASAAISATLVGSPHFAGADQPASNQAAVMARIDELASAMKEVGKAVEPSVVNIEVEKRGNAAAAGRGDINEEMLKRLFPDEDGDGEPDVPPGLRFRFGGPRGEGNEGLRSYGEGSGVILDATGDKAYVLTNNHVAGNATKIVVTLSDGRRIDEVRVIGADPLSDLAVLEIKGEGFVASRWGKSETLEKGDIVLAFGSPFGYVGSMTQGIVSGTNRSTNPRGGAGLLGQMGYEYFIQTDCAINPGNSGGPLVNVHGEIVGINTAIASSTGSFNGIGFAIPSSLARSVYEQIKETGKVTRGYLGVKIGDSRAVDKRLQERLKIADKPGVIVDTVTRDAPAAGKLEPNDVITSFNGERVKTAGELRLMVAATKPETNVKLGVIRGGKEQIVEMALGTLPDQHTQTAAADKEEPDPAASNDEVGATLTDASAARLKAAGLPEDAKGALVTAVKGGSPAQLAGLTVGDLITRIGDTEVTTAADAVNALKEHKLAEGISILVVNREGTKSIFVQVEK